MSEAAQVVGPFHIDLDLYGRLSFRRGLTRPVTVLLTAITVLVVMVGQFWGPSALLGGLVGYLYVPIMLVSRWFAVRRALAHPLNRVLKLPRIVRFDDERLSQEVPGKSLTELTWELVVQSEERDGFFLLMLSQVSLMVVPLSAMTAEQAAELRRILRKHRLRTT